MKNFFRLSVLSLRLLAGDVVLALALVCTTTSAAPVTATNALAAGTRFATEYFVHDSGQPGPTILIVGGVHGNEPAGAHAAESLRHWPIASGKLVVIPRANVLALKANKRLTPNLNTNLSNLNRNYPRAGKSEPARGELAEAIWEVALKFKPDWVLDLHEGYDFNQVNEKSVGSSVISFPNPNGKTAADLMIAAVNAGITDEKLKFVRRDLPIDGSLARAAGEHLHVPGMTLETTSKQPLEKRVRQHEVMVHRLLQHLGMMGDQLPPAPLARAQSETTLRIALYKGPGTGGNGPPSLLQKLNHAPDSSIVQVTPEEIQANVLTNYDVVIFGGGSGSKQAEALGETGRANVQRFVERGGGYIGICAGAYLATSGYPWSLKMINARTVSPIWRRGKGTVKMELTKTGSTILGQRDSQFDVLYANGPIVKPDNQADLPKFETLAYFRTEMAENGSPAGVMVDAPAIFSGQYKQGRVVCISPHPEQTQGLQDIVPRAVNWVAPKVRPVASKANPKAE